eukprot:TRINITY_DN11799_c0_g1_i1.p1 TRINITY_DN11799_c0_g1~~TRINITY_DN11799_c0_g1_i1.p1  ORF type:complete len:202 (-),score=34.06 TRINITY_DN11799_c0_g1_i1:427-1032(-)
MLRSLVGSEMCIRDRYQRRVRDSSSAMEASVQGTRHGDLDGEPRSDQLADSGAVHLEPRDYSEDGSETEDLELADGLHSGHDEEKMALSGHRRLREDLSVGWDDVPCVRLYRGLRDWKDPKSGRGIPKRPVCLGFFLFALGVVFCMVFLVGAFVWGFGRSIPYGVIGIIGLLPGGYVMVVTYKAYNREPGWNFGQIRAQGD